MKTLKFSLIGLTLAVSLSATADIRTIAEAYEIALSDVQMPASVNGVLAFKRCATCELEVVNVNDHTEYVLDRKNIELADFRRSLATVRDRSAVTIIVKHHLESDTIVRVSVTL